MADPLTLLKEACAFVHSDDAWGSGYLISTDQVATCAHVVGSLKSGRTVRVVFSWGSTEAVVEHTDDLADAAILRLSKPAQVKPLQRARLCPDGASWSAHGFPAIAQTGAASGPTAITIKGDVRDAFATDVTGSPAIQLYSDDAAAGKGAFAQGLSGSPVFVNETVVGHLKRVLPEDSSGRAALGLLYACPIRLVEQLAGLEPAKAPRKPQAAGVPYDPEWYIHREAEEQLALSYLEDGAPVMLRGPEKCGKSTTMCHILDRLSATAAQLDTRCRIVTIDLNLLATSAGLSGDVLLDQLMDNIARGVGSGRGPGRRLSSRLIWTVRLTRWMEDQILPAAGERLVLAIENASALLGLPVQNDFYNMLKCWSEQVHREPWSRLRMLMTISTTPALLIEGAECSRSPWNVRPIDLGDFDETQVFQLAQAYELPWTQQEIRDNLMTHIGGHPFLLRTAMHDARQRRRTLQEVAGDASHAGGVFGWYLSSLLRHLSTNQTLFSALKKVLRTPMAAPSNNPVFEKLSDAGIVKWVPGSGYRIRYPMYENCLRKQWNL